MPDKQLGFIGVGRMGQHMASRLIEAGYALTIFDTNETAMQRLEQRGIPYADFGAWAMKGWQQIFFHDPDGNVIEVHEAKE